MTPKEKSEELVENIGVYNGLYLVDEVLLILEDYPNNNSKEWEDVRKELEIRLEKLNKI